MPSPFPGMDPHLEDPAVWPDFHSTMIHCLREAIGERLPEAYDACIEERVSISFGHDDVRTVIADVGVTADPLRPPGPPAAGATATAVLEPVAVPLAMHRTEREIYVAIIRRPDQRLVTVVELLSPTNKTGDGRVEYLAKREVLLRQPVHLVEIDLIRGGARMPMARPMPPGDCFAVVARSERRPMADVFAWGLRSPLPTVPVPLAAPDPDVPVALGPAMALAYDRGRLGRRCRYSAPPPGPLGDDDARWAAEVAAHAARSRTA